MLVCGRGVNMTSGKQQENRRIKKPRHRGNPEPYRSEQLRDGASRLSEASTNLKLASYNFSSIEVLNCRYGDRYMKADKTYDYVTNGLSRHNS